MATITATITVDFVANYAGTHRVCWRIQGSGDPYDCSTEVSCVGGGTVCQAIIEADVNDTSCDGEVIFEGYTQAACEDVASINGRDSWTASFTPTVVCRRYEVTCENSVIEALTVTSVGSNYNPAALPTVTITGDGAGATADAVVADDSVTSVTLGALPGGSGYGDGVYVDHPVTGGTGTGMLISFTVVGGEVVSVEGTSSVSEGGDGGSGYTASDVLQPDPAGPAGAPGVAYTFTVDAVQTGQVTSLTLTAAGSGYSTAGVIIDPPGGGETATATATIAVCGVRDDIGPDCDGGEEVSLEGMEVGTTFAVCIAGDIINLTSQYSYVETGCCIAEDSVDDVCFDYHIENLTGDDLQVRVTPCGGDAIWLDVANGATEAICAVDGGVSDPSLAGLTITNTGTPCS